MQDKQRYRFIDYYKGMAIILVVLGHVNFANEHIVGWIFGFHIPAFFLASGLLLDGAAPYTFERFSTSVGKRFRSLIVPYAVWGFIYAPFSLDTVLRIAYGSRHALLNAGTVTSLWFLPTLFLALAFYEFLRLLLKERFAPPVRMALAGAALAVALLLPNIERGYPWSVDVAFCALAFVLLGSVLRPYLDRLRQLVREKRSLGLFICVLGLATAFAGTMAYLLNDVQVNTARSTYGIAWVFLLQATSGCLLLAFASVLLDAVVPSSTQESGAGNWDVLGFLGRNAFGIYVLHKPLIWAIFKKQFDAYPLPWGAELAVAAVGVLVISSLLVVVISRFAPFLVGKPQQRARIPKGGQGA